MPPKKLSTCALVESHGEMEYNYFFVKSLCSDGLYNNVQIGIKNLTMKEIIYLSRQGFEPNTQNNLMSKTLKSSNKLTTFLLF